MRKRTRLGTFVPALVALLGFLTACSAPPSLAEDDIVGTWSYEKGGTVTFEEDTIIVDDLYLSPFDGRGFGEDFQGAGTWKINDKPYVYFKLAEWSQRAVPSAPGKTFSSSFRAVERDGELQLEMYDAAQDVRHYLTKD